MKSLIKIILISIFTILFFIPTPTKALNCSSLTTRGDCGPQAGCIWQDGACQKINCSNFTTRGDCGPQAGCMWQDGACQSDSNYYSTIPVSTFSENVEGYNATIGLNSELTTLNGIISTFLPYILSLAGVLLLFMLISGGFTMLTAVSDPEKADTGKQRISAALLGFILLFISYWIIQILEIILGINILGS